jgi:long-chain acyl-CoA synthetase
MNVSKIIERSAFYFPDRTAVCSNGRENNYCTLNGQANRVATALLDLGVSPGDHIALCAPNSFEWIAFYFGIMKTGAIAVTLSSQLTAAELTQATTDSKPKYIFTTDDKIGVLKSLQKPGLLESIISRNGDLSFEKLCDHGTDTFDSINRDRTDTAAILYTGGTTGIPKGVMLSHENIYTAIYNVVFNERSTEKDRVLCFLPFNHVFAQMHIMNAALLSGGCIELIPAFNLEDVLEITAAGKVTKLYGVPTVYVRLLSVENLRKKLGTVRYSFSAAANMAVELIRQWKQSTGLVIHEATA